MFRKSVFWALASLLIFSLTACSDDPSVAVDTEARWVRVTPVEPAGRSLIGLSGTVRARFETPVGFQVGGLISERLVDAGQTVDSGEVIFRLDPRDLQQSVQVAQADVDAAQAELATAAAETRRNRDLLAREFISDQVFERVELAENAAREHVAAAQARLEQAINALGYGNLTAGQPGTLIDVIGEPGQVVSAGQTMALIAANGAREVEVFLPEMLGIPEQARLRLPNADPVPLALREVAGAADPVTRTWAARYSIVGPVGPDTAPRLGSVVRVELDLDRDYGLPGNVVQVPIAAVSERGQGPQLWLIVAGKARPIPIQVVTMDGEHARVIGDLDIGDEVIALGTHLLQDGMAVRALPAR